MPAICARASRVYTPPLTMSKANAGFIRAYNPADGRGRGDLNCVASRAVVFFVTAVKLIFVGFFAKFILADG